MSSAWWLSAAFHKNGPMSARPLTRPSASLSRGEGASSIKKNSSLAPGARVKVNGAAAGVDHVTAEEFERHLEEHREKLSHAPKEGS